MNKRLWITWEYQPRNISMSNALGCEYKYFSSDAGLIFRYVYLSGKTMLELIKMRGGVVFAQNPSIVLSFLVVFFRHIFGYTCVIDEHNAGLFPINRKSKVLNFFADYIVKNANFLIVTNEELVEYSRKKGGKALVCPDPLPNMATADTVIVSGGFTIMLVCSWADDEPYEEVVAAAEKLKKSDVVIYATGKPGEKLNHLSLPDNFKLTGYLTNSDYKATMAAVDAVMVLTMRDGCMNCGAYEAVASGKPGILSDRAVLRNYFTQGFEFTENNKTDIYMAVIELKQKYKNKIGEVKALKSILLKTDDKYIAALNSEIV